MAAVTENVPAAEEQRVSALELFFDLVLVFAVTQVSDFLAEEPDWTRLAEALAILAVLWWAWVGYAFFGNTTGSDAGIVRVVLLLAMVPLLVVSLAVPEAFGDDALVFGVAYFAVRILHLVGYAVAAREDPQLGDVVRRLASTIVPASALLVVAGTLDGTAQAACWVAALAIDYGVLALRSVEGWRIEPAHFAERHGLFVIIALGESIVSLGGGARGLELDAPIVEAAALGIVVAAALWWAYFDFVALAGAQALAAKGGTAQARMARDSYTYLHLPMVAGIVLFAFGVRSGLRAGTDELEEIAAVALCGGVALYLVALSAFRRLNYGAFNAQRLIAAGVLAVLAAVGSTLPALALMGAVAVVTVALLAYETVRFADARARFRRG